MKQAHSSTSAVLLTIALALPLAACASAGGGDGATDARIDGDGAPISTPADADPDAPDANPTTGGADANDGTCPTAPCDLVQQCGCQPGWACDLDGTMVATGGTECRGVNAQGMEASTCSAVEDCAAGYICIGANPAQCRRYCATDADCTGGGSLCLISITSGGNPVPGAVTCTKDCDAVATANPTGCPTGMACHLFVDDPDNSLPTASGDERFLTDCLTAGAGTDNASCAANGMTDCAPGHDCVNLGGNNVCKQTCAYPGGACAVGACQRYAAPRPIINGQEYGVCN